MAQETEPTERPRGTSATGEDRPSQFHYYSGGEVKEMENTPVSPTLIAFWTIVIIGAVGYFLFGGALGPKFGGFQPTGGSQQGLSQVQQSLNQRGGNAQLVSTLDLNALPLPAGLTLAQTISRGSEVYQTNCIGCHGPNQDGNGVNASSLNPKPRNLRDAPFMQAMSLQRITTSLHKGVPGTAMPRWENTLSEDQISAVRAYVYSLTAPPPSQVEQANSGKSLNGSTTGTSGGSNSYVNGEQNSPKPITPAIGGNPAAATTTAPPSTGNSPVNAINPMAGGTSKNPPLQMAAPRASAPVPGSDTSNVNNGVTPGGGSGM